MRFFSIAAIAALIAAGPVSAFAQTTGTAPAAPAKTAAPAASVCKGRAEADCQAPTCTWVAASTTAAGKAKKAYCRKAAKAKKAAKPAT